MSSGLPPYDGGLKSRDAHVGFLRRLAKSGAGLVTGPRPTAEQLEKHAKRFGPAQVAETAAELGVEVDVSGIEEPRRPRRRRR